MQHSHEALDRPGGLARVATLAPLRHRDFRLLFTGQAVSFLGSMVTYVAIPYQVYRLSGSSLVVGLLGLVELVPLLGTAFVGGALADAIDRRRMVQVTELSLAGASGVLLANALLPSPQLWLLFVVAALMAGLDGLQRPSLEALAPRLVTREELPAEGALSSLRGTAGMIAGPALGAFVLQQEPLALWPAAAALCLAAGAGGLRLERRLPEAARRTPGDVVAAMPPEPDSETAIEPASAKVSG